MARRSRKLDEEDLSSIQSISTVDDDEAFEVFCRHKMVENVQAVTIKHYREIRHVIYRDLPRAGISKKMVELSTKDIEDLIIYWKGTVKIGTINNRIRVMKPYYKVLAQKKILKRDPMAEIKQIKEREVIRDTLSEEEVSVLADYFKRKKTFANFRNLTMLLLLLDTGIRIGECLNLRVSDLKEDNSLVVCLTKNLKERLVFPSKHCISFLNTYLKIRGEIKGEDHLFVSVYNERLQTRTFQDSLREAGVLCGISKPVSPHVLRRTYAKNAVISGIDPFSLARLMGHSSLDVTALYVQMWGGDLKNQSIHRADYSKYF